MRILSFGAGMQSTALALMSCANAQGWGDHRQVPVYDAIIYVDMGLEPPWVAEQVRFVQRRCRESGVAFYLLKSSLHDDYMRSFDRSRVASIPFWTMGADGRKGRMPRNCTPDYKIRRVQQFVRWELLGYSKGQRTRSKDRKGHEMHLGFSSEEGRRTSENSHILFKNHYPLIQMGWTRTDCYRYCLEVWNLETKASACSFCPCHTNSYYLYLKREYPEHYARLVAFDHLLAQQKPDTVRKDLYLSRSCKRLCDLTDTECADGQYILYKGSSVWTGF